MPPINIGTSVQLLVDNLVVEYVNFVTRVVHPPDAKLRFFSRYCHLYSIRVT